MLCSRLWPFSQLCLGSHFNLHISDDLQCYILGRHLCIFREMSVDIFGSFKIVHSVLLSFSHLPADLVRQSFIRCVSGEHPPLSVASLASLPDQKCLILTESSLLIMPFTGL